jgi:transposase
MVSAQKIDYVRRAQKDYTKTFKLQVIQEIEQRELSTHVACSKYCIQALSTIVK